MPFGSLHEILQENINTLGYVCPTPIQTKAIPIIIGGKDVIVAAQTGTGKTATYALPILNMLIKSDKKELGLLQALIVVPTRELSLQITTAIREYSRGLDLRILNISGGINISKQIASLNKGADIIVATSGRFVELNKQGFIPLSKVKFLVLDEADTMLDMGFVREIEQIIDMLPTKKQTMLFSATMNGAVKRLSEKILNKPSLVEIDNLSAADMTITQIVHPVLKEQKSELLSYLIGSNNYPQTLVFTRNKATADEVSEYLKLSGLKCAVIHGDKKHGARDKALAGFRSGLYPILVATDIAARGLDIDSLDMVINYDIPHVITDYIHRIGRTGRANRDGVAITLLSSNELISWKKIELLLGKAPQRVEVKGFEVPTGLIIKTRGKSLLRENTDKPKKAAGAFGNKKKKELVQPKYATKRGPKVARPVVDERKSKKNKKR